jgi:hypothetical protein
MGTTKLQEQHSEVEEKKTSQFFFPTNALLCWAGWWGRITLVVLQCVVGSVVGCGGLRVSHRGEASSTAS